MRHLPRLLVIASVIGLTIMQPAPAMANPYTPQGVCGSGYGVIDSYTSTYADVFLLWNGAYNCVVTMKKGASVGTTHYTRAWLEVRGQAAGYDDFRTDGGTFQYYAGPVKLYGVNRCVMWGGYQYYGSSMYGGATANWEHCA